MAVSIETHAGGARGPSGCGGAGRVSRRARDPQRAQGWYPRSRQRVVVRTLRSEFEGSSIRRRARRRRRAGGRAAVSASTTPGGRRDRVAAASTAAAPRRRRGAGPAPPRPLVARLGARPVVLEVARPTSTPRSPTARRDRAATLELADQPGPGAVVYSRAARPSTTCCAPRSPRHQATALVHTVAARLASPRSPLSGATSTGRSS